MTGECGARADCFSSSALRTGEDAERMTLWARNASTEPSSAVAARVTSRNCSRLQMSEKERLRRLSKLFQEMSYFSVAPMMAEVMMPLRLSESILLTVFT